MRSFIERLWVQLSWLLGSGFLLAAYMGAGLQWMVMSVRLILYGLCMQASALPFVVWYAFSPNIVRRVPYRNSHREKVAVVAALAFLQRQRSSASAFQHAATGASLQGPPKPQRTDSISSSTDSSEAVLFSTLRNNLSMPSATALVHEGLLREGVPRTTAPTAATSSSSSPRGGPHQQGGLPNTAAAAAEGASHQNSMPHQDGSGASAIEPTEEDKRNLLVLYRAVRQYLAFRTANPSSSSMSSNSAARPTKSSVMTGDTATSQKTTVAIKKKHSNTINQPESPPPQPLPTRVLFRLLKTALSSVVRFITYATQDPVDAVAAAASGAPAKSPKNAAPTVAAAGAASSGEEGPHTPAIAELLAEVLQGGTAVHGSTTSTTTSTSRDTKTQEKALLTDFLQWLEARCDEDDAVKHNRAILDVYLPVPLHTLLSLKQQHASAAGNGLPRTSSAARIRGGAGSSSQGPTPAASLLSSPRTPRPPTSLADYTSPLASPRAPAHGSSPAAAAHPPTKPFKVVVVISGGAWIIGCYLWSAFIARVFVAAGYIVFVPDYRNFPQTDIHGMTTDVTDALAWILENVPKYHGDPEDITVTGHSAGAHLSLLALLSAARRCANRSAAAPSRRRLRQQRPQSSKSTTSDEKKTPAEPVTESGKEADLSAALCARLGACQGILDVLRVTHHQLTHHGSHGRAAGKRKRKTQPAAPTTVASAASAVVGRLQQAEAFCPILAEMDAKTPPFNPRKVIRQYIGVSGLYDLAALSLYLDDRGLYRRVQGALAGYWGDPSAGKTLREAAEYDFEMSFSENDDTNDVEPHAHIHNSSLGSLPIGLTPLTTTGGAGEKSGKPPQGDASEASELRVPNSVLRATAYGAEDELTVYLRAVSPWWQFVTRVVGQTTTSSTNSASSAKPNKAAPADTTVADVSSSSTAGETSLVPDATLVPFLPRRIVFVHGAEDKSAPLEESSAIAKVIAEAAAQHLREQVEKKQQRQQHNHRPSNNNNNNNNNNTNHASANNSMPSSPRPHGGAVGPLVLDPTAWESVTVENIVLLRQSHTDPILEEVMCGQSTLVRIAAGPVLPAPTVTQAVSRAGDGEMPPSPKKQNSSSLRLPPKKQTSSARENTPQDEGPAAQGQQPLLAHSVSQPSAEVSPQRQGLQNTSFLYDSTYHRMNMSLSTKPVLSAAEEEGEEASTLTSSPRAEPEAPPQRESDDLATTTTTPSKGKTGSNKKRNAKQKEKAASVGTTSAGTAADMTTAENASSVSSVAPVAAPLVQAVPPVTVDLPLVVVELPPLVPEEAMPFLLRCGRRVCPF